jgi:proteasome lid subunit RPN8/RPN11
MILVLSRSQFAQMVAHVRAGLPNEACGLLGGEAGRVRQVYPVENIRRSPVEYQMDPAQQVETMVAIEAAGWELTGIYHSHPSGPSVPSPTDIAQAYYPESIYVILAPDAAGEWQGRAFQIDGRRAQEVRLEIVE